MLIRTIFSVFLFGKVICSEETLELSDEEYYQLPELYEVQDYIKCLSQHENAYCSGVFELSSPGSSQLYDVLKKLSANTRENFNHTRIHRAVCLGPTSACPVTGNLTDSFEKCIERKMFEKYGLHTHLMHFDFCRRPGEKLKLDGVDVAFCIYLIIVTVLNVVGTVYDCFLRKENVKGNRWLMAFSLFDNWKRLTSTSEGKDPRFENLSCFYGIKTLSMFIVHIAHAGMLIGISLPTNPRFTEESIRRPEGKFFFYHGNIIIQSFVFVANFLTAYKMLVFSEKYEMKFSLMPKLLIDRIVRMHPMHLTGIGIAATISAHLNDGPLWYKYVTKEMANCRDLWWYHVFFIHNSRRWAECLPQTWHLAMDVQVYIICCIIMLWILSRRLDPEYVLKWLLVASLLLLFAIIYLLELRPQLTIVNPENIQTLFAEEISNVYLYQSPWGNLPAAILGLLVASTYYRLEKEKVDLTKSKTFVVMNHLTVPLMFLWCFMIYFTMNMESRLFLSLYATVEKCGFAAILSVLIIGCFYKFEGPVTTILCWPGWIVLSRLSLGSLVVHITVNQHISFSRMHNSMSYTQIFADAVAVSVISYLVALPLTLLIEYPAVQLYKSLTESISDDKRENLASVKSKHS